MEYVFVARLPDADISRRSDGALVVDGALRGASWSVPEARVGDTVELRAEVAPGVADGTPATFEVWESDERSPDDFVAKLAGAVRGGVARASWRYVYAPDADDVRSEQDFGGYRLPEYYFIADVQGERVRSPLLEFRSWLDISLALEGRPVPNAAYALHLPDGTTREGRTDASGKAREERVPPGRYRLEFQDHGCVPKGEGPPPADVLRGPPGCGGLGSTVASWE